jgi:hypothetical protein
LKFCSKPFTLPQGFPVSFSPQELSPGCGPGAITLPFQRLIPRRRSSQIRQFRFRLSLIFSRLRTANRDMGFHSVFTLTLWFISERQYNTTAYYKKIIPLPTSFRNALTVPG